MTTPRRALLATLAGAFTALLPLAAAQAQAWPAKPVTLVVSYPPGGGADIMARLISPRLGDALGQPVIVENRPGGSGQLAAGAVTRAPADGYTLLFDASSYAVTPTLFPTSPYKGGKAFRTIAVTALFPNVVLVHPGFAARNVAELVAAAKKAPDAVAFASSGNGSAQHLAGVLFEQSAGVQMMHVPYKGGGPALNDVMGGQVPVFFGNLASTLGHVQSGRLRALAVTGHERRRPAARRRRSSRPAGSRAAVGCTSERSKALPDVPTVEQAGLRSVESYEWNGLFAPVGTPDAVVERLQVAVRQALAAPEVRERITALGGEPFRGNAEEAARFVNGEADRMAKLVKARAITVE